MLHVWLISEAISYSEESFGASVSRVDGNESVGFVAYVTFPQRMAKRGSGTGGEWVE